MRYTLAEIEAVTDHLKRQCEEFIAELRDDPRPEAQAIVREWDALEAEDG